MRKRTCRIHGEWLSLFLSLRSSRARAKRSKVFSSNGVDRCVPLSEPHRIRRALGLRAVPNRPVCMSRRWKINEADRLGFPPSRCRSRVRVSFASHGPEPHRDTVHQGWPYAHFSIGLALFFLSAFLSSSAFPLYFSLPASLPRLDLVDAASLFNIFYDSHVALGVTDAVGRWTLCRTGWVFKVKYDRFPVFSKRVDIFLE